MTCEAKSQQKLDGQIDFNGRIAADGSIIEEAEGHDE